MPDFDWIPGFLLDRGVSASRPGRDAKTSHSKERPHRIAIYNPILEPQIPSIIVRLESGIVDAFLKRRIALLSLSGGVPLLRPSVSLAMSSRAIQYSSHQNAVPKSSQPAIQRTLEFGGVKRKADGIKDSNKRTSPERTSLLATRLSTTPEKGIGLIQTVTRTNSFSEKKGQIVLGGEVFNEADFDDFDDIEIDDWDVPPATCQSTVAVETNWVVNNSVVVEDEDDYFKDDNDSD